MVNGHSARLSSGSALGLLRADAMVAECCDVLRREELGLDRVRDDFPSRSQMPSTDNQRVAAATIKKNRCVRAEVERSWLW